MMQFGLIKEARTWYVVFDRMRTPRRVSWLQFFLSKKWGHTILLTKSKDGCIKVDPLMWGMHITHVDEDIEQHLSRYIKIDTTAVLSYTVDYGREDEYKFRGLYNCIVAVKAILAIKGLRSFFVFGPKQLYKYLVRQPGTIVIKAFTPYIK